MLVSQLKLPKKNETADLSNSFVRISPAAIGAVNPVVKRNQLRKSKE